MCQSNFYLSSNLLNHSKINLPMVFQKMINYIKRKRKNFKILFIGLDNSGKSSIINTLFLKENEQPLCPPTFGFRISSVDYQDLKLDILDIGGQTIFQQFWSNYFEKADGVVFIVDSTDNRDSSGYLNTVLDLGLPVVILFNKIDLNPRFEIPESLEKLKKCKAFKTTVYERESVERGFSWLIDSLKGERGIGN